MAAVRSTGAVGVADADADADGDGVGAAPLSEGSLPELSHQATAAPASTSATPPATSPTIVPRFTVPR